MRLPVNPERQATRGYYWTSNTTPQAPGWLPAQWVTLKSKSPPDASEPRTVPLASTAAAVAKRLDSVSQTEEGMQNRLLIGSVASHTLVSRRS